MVFGQQKIRLNRQECRGTYQDPFKHANRYAAGYRVVIANADINLDETLASLTRSGG